MAGETYTRRYGGGFADGSGGGTPIDSAFLNAVETRLLYLLGEDPASNEVPVWTPASSRFVFQKITNAQIDAAAAIDKSKLASLSIVNADVSGAAAIAQSKLALDITNAQVNAAAGILLSKLDITFGTSPPGSPNDGSVWIYPADTTNGVMWVLRYRTASASSYKWEFVGGTSLRVHVATAETTTGAGYADLATLTAVTVPRAGEYVIAHGCELSNNGTGNYSYASVKLGSASTSAADRAVAYQGAANEAATVFTHLADVKTLAASDVVKQQYGASAGTVTVNNRNLIVLPVRIS